MKIIFVAFAVLTAVNLAAASADSIRFSTEATAILTDYETRIPPVIGTVLPRFTTIVNTAIGNYAAVRKTLNDQLSALGPVGAALGSTLVKAIKVDQAAITPSVNLALLKTNLTIILSGFNSIFAEVSAGITSDAAIIDQYPTAISCWENGKQQVMDTEASSALAFEQMTAYNLQDTADNVTPVQGQIGFLGNEVNTFIAAAAAAPQPLSYVSLGIQIINYNLFYLSFSSVHRQPSCDSCHICEIRHQRWCLLELANSSHLGNHGRPAAI